MRLPVSHHKKARGREDAAVQPLNQSRWGSQMKVHLSITHQLCEHSSIFTDYCDYLFNSVLVRT